MDAVQAANSGHPGMPMGAAPMAVALWTRHLRHNPSNPKWFDRDRFILSAGHGSMLLYSLLHLTGYDLSLDELRSFRQWGSRTPGHPENHLTPGVEMATGPLGQGFATGVGMAIAERFLSATFNRPGHVVVDHHTYAIVSDGDLMEGITNEAASLAGHLGLGKLIYLYDDNGISIDGSTKLAFTEDVLGRFDALGWHTDRVDGMDVDAVDQAIVRAKAETGRPSLIACRTVIGFGSPNKGGTEKTHGSPLGEEELRLTKEALGIPLEPRFFVADAAREAFGRAVSQGEAAENEWNERFAGYATAHPEGAAILRRAMAGDFAPEWNAFPEFADKIATRAASGKVLNAIAPVVPTLLGGSADLAGSVNTTLAAFGTFQQDSPTGRTFCFGVREHAMAAALNGMNLHGGVRAYGGTFLIFSDYCRPAVRLAALMGCPTPFVFTHDSIGLGEDGPTHQPVEHLAALRAIPNLHVMRPADGNETAVCWRMALASPSTPCALALTRQSLSSTTPPPGADHPALRGGYVLAEPRDGRVDVILVATGSEVALALAAREALAKEGIGARVVSMPCTSVFDGQDSAYRQAVLPQGVPTVSIEAASTFGWAKYAEAHVGLDRFGASAPAERLFEEFGFTVENVVAVARGLLPMANA
ncbi:MAG: transketolase [Fimbriimonadaceae bacterium]|nr:transketolase [Fimbriimonadaceae bacterium]